MTSGLLHANRQRIHRRLQLRVEPISGRMVAEIVDVETQARLRIIPADEILTPTDNDGNTTDISISI